MSRYDKFQAKASKDLAKWAQGTITLTRSVTGSPDPGANPWDPPPIGEIKVYKLDAVARAVESKYVDGTTVFATDIMVTASASMSLLTVDGEAPAEVEIAEVDFLPGDAMAVDGGAVTVIKTMRIPRAGTVVAWKVICRG